MSGLVLLAMLGGGGLALGVVGVVVDHKVARGLGFWLVAVMAGYWTYSFFVGHGQDVAQSAARKAASMGSGPGPMDDPGIRSWEMARLNAISAAVSYAVGHLFFSSRAI